MDSEILTIDNERNNIIIEYLAIQLVKKIEHKRESGRARSNRWYELHRKKHKDEKDEYNNVINKKVFRNGRPRKFIKIDDVKPLITI
jgi:hypothetical protein